MLGLDMAHCPHGRSRSSTKSEKKKILKAYSLNSRNCQRKEDRETSISLVPLPPRAF